MQVSVLREALSLNRDLNNELVHKRKFEATIKGITADIIYNEYTDCYLLVVNQVAESFVNCRIVLNKPLAEGDTTTIDFCIDMGGNQDGFEDAAKLIASKLEIDKPLEMYLCLVDLQKETVMEVIEVLLKNR